VCGGDEWYCAYLDCGLEETQQICLCSCATTTTATSATVSATTGTVTSGTLTGTLTPTATTLSTTATGSATSITTWVTTVSATGTRTVTPTSSVTTIKTTVTKTVISTTSSTGTATTTEEWYCGMVNCGMPEAMEKCPNTCMAIPTTATATSSPIRTTTTSPAAVATTNVSPTPTTTTTTAPAAVAVLIGGFSLFLSEPADFARAFDQGDSAVSAALASGIAAVLPTATPDDVEITSVVFEGRLLSTAAGVEAGAGSAGVQVSFEATLPAASALAAGLSAHEFLQAGDALETNLALELAQGARNFTVFGVSVLEATLAYVAVAGTTTASDSATYRAPSYNKMLAVLISLCVAVFCVFCFCVRQSRGCGRKRKKGGCGISDPSDVPAVPSGLARVQPSPITPLEGADPCPPQPPLSSRMQPLGSRHDSAQAVQLQLAPGEAEGDEAIAGFGCCKVASLGVWGQPSSVQEVPKAPVSTWRLKLGEVATFEGVWDGPWSEQRPTTESSSLNILEVTYEYR